MNKSNNSIGTESTHSSDSGYNNKNSSNNNNNNYTHMINHLLPNSIKNGHSYLKNQLDSLDSLSLNNNNNNYESNKSNMSVVNMKDLIENYAYKFFKENEKEYYKKMGKSYGWKEMTKEIEWKGLRVKHEEIKYQSPDATQAAKSAHVLFKTTFINDSKGEQEYQLNAERKTMSSCSFEIYEGYSNEGSCELSLEIPLPGVVATAGAGFKREYTLENSRSKSIQEEMNWSVQSNIKVPAMSKTTAELFVNETQFKSTFEIKTYFSGYVRYKLFKDFQEVLLIELTDLEDILTKEKGFNKDTKGIYKITKGECKANFGVEQRIELHQTSL